MKSLFFLLTICWFTTSCSRGYGCPYTSVEKETERPSLTVDYDMEAVPADLKNDYKCATATKATVENHLWVVACE